MNKIDRKTWMQVFSPEPIKTILNFQTSDPREWFMSNRLAAAKHRYMWIQFITESCSRTERARTRNVQRYWNHVCTCATQASLLQSGDKLMAHCHILFSNFNVTNWVRTVCQKLLFMYGNFCGILCGIRFVGEISLRPSLHNTSEEWWRIGRSMYNRMRRD